MIYQAKPSTIYRNLSAARISEILLRERRTATAFRPPVRGEAFLALDGTVVARAEKESYVDPRIILSAAGAAVQAQAAAPAVPNQLVYTAAESYPQGVPAAPEGFRISAFRFNVAGETILGGDGRAQRPQTQLRKPMYILSEVEQAVPALPVGFFE